MIAHNTECYAEPSLYMMHYRHNANRMTLSIERIPPSRPHNCFYYNKL